MQCHSWCVRGSGARAFGITEGKSDEGAACDAKCWSMSCTEGTSHAGARCVLKALLIQVQCVMPQVVHVAQQEHVPLKALLVQAWRARPQRVHSARHENVMQFTAPLIQSQPGMSQIVRVARKELVLQAAVLMQVWRAKLGRCMRHVKLVVPLNVLLVQVQRVVPQLVRVAHEEHIAPLLAF